MIQWVGLALAVLGFLWNGVKDYQTGAIKIPVLPERKEVLTRPVYPVQYCLMAYDPNLDKVFYLHENGQWYDYAPEQRRYSTTQEIRKDKTENQEALGNSHGPQGASRYHYGQQAQTPTYAARR